ncbi:DUF4856 domain-containing protein [Parashewanella tropica]|uniref:DUF4856 domain-containing protein n=1 Tax=Parashewanella tropica TaxID=2547970 RepID=UPI00105AA777|nr:DUF4856 domain-containing protein [Parashewanella tropica]
MKKQNLALAVSAALVLSACGGSSNKDKNTAPTDISVSAMKVDENMPGATIGTLSATDANSGDSHTFSVEGDMFVVEGNTLKLAPKKSANYEMAKTLKVKVTAKDKAGLSFSKDLTISVNDLLDTYTFKSKLVEDKSSVSYSGQTARHVLIAELNKFIGTDLKQALKDGDLTTKQAVLDQLNKFFRTTEEQYDNFPVTFTDKPLQENLVAISSSHKNLVGKLAGNDATGQHKNWNNGDFEGWGAKGSKTPETLVDMFFEQLATNAEKQIKGEARVANETQQPITEIYINEDGTDLKQLIQKFLLMAITYSQATDDYLGHETDGKGLTTDNTKEAKAGKAYTNLEHQFDEGFGYFGAARDYLEYNDNEIAGKVKTAADGRADWNGKHDTNKDGKIDLLSEINYGQSVNAAKRDRGTKDNAKPTDFTKTTMEAFLAGRKIINDNVKSALTTEQMTKLKAHRDVAVDGWERAIAATVVHYINDSIADLDKLGTDDFKHADLAKHWSEMKGFALGLQFNPYSKISDEQFAMIHEKMGTKPVLTVAERDAYKAKLLEARNIIQQALTFDADNVKNW